MRYKGVGLPTETYRYVPLHTEYGLFSFNAPNNLFNIFLIMRKKFSFRF